MLTALGPLYAVADPGAVEAVSGAADSLGDTLLSIAGFVLPIAAGIVAIVFGWRWACRQIYVVREDDYTKFDDR